MLISQSALVSCEINTEQRENGSNLQEMSRSIYDVRQRDSFDRRIFKRVAESTGAHKY